MISLQPSFLYLSQCSPVLMAMAESSAGDFHEPHQPPLSAALPPPEDHPPTWDSLDLNTPLPRVGKDHQGYTAEEEKMALEEMERSGRVGRLEAALREADKPSVEQRGFVV